MTSTYTYGEYKVSGSLTTNKVLNVGTFGPMIDSSGDFYCKSLSAPKYALTRGSSGSVVVNGTTPVLVNTAYYALDGNTVIRFTNRSQTLVATPPFKSPRVQYIASGLAFYVVADAGDTQTYNWIAIN